MSRYLLLDNPTKDEAVILEELNIIASVFSIIGSCFIIICYFKFSELRSFAFYLVLMMAISDFFFSIGNFLGDTGGNPDTWIGADNTLCHIQALFIQYWNLASIFWAASIAFTLHKAILYNDPRFNGTNIKTYKIHYNIICFGVPLLLTILPAITNSYGDTGGWCWISRKNTIDIVWRYLTFYIELWVIVGYNCYIYYKIYNIVQDCIKETEDSETKQKTRKMINRIKYYPLVLIICYICASLNLIVETVIGGKFIMGLQGSHIFMVGLTGVFNAIVYGLTPDVKKNIKKSLCNNTTNEKMITDLYVDSSKQVIQNINIPANFV